MKKCCDSHVTLCLKLRQTGKLYSEVIFPNKPTQYLVQREISNFRVVLEVHALQKHLGYFNDILGCLSSISVTKECDQGMLPRNATNEKLELH